MSQTPLYPLRFEPIYQHRPWGGRQLANLLSAPLPSDGPVGEAWVLSDRDDCPSRVAEGPLEGDTLRQLLNRWPEQMMGNLAGCFHRFPLLLKFLDVRSRLSIQVHPSDERSEFLPAGETGKTEAWVVLESGADARVYAGLKPLATSGMLRHAIENKTLADHLACFRPKVGDGVFVPAGTVHSLGDVVVFEVQENSDVTFRLYDWDHVDAQTGKPRPLQIDQALACIDFSQNAISPVTPHIETNQPLLRERLFCCKHFGLWRLRSEWPFTVGAEATPRVVVCLAGDGHLDLDGDRYDIGRGDVFLLPAIVGACRCLPGDAITVLEMSLPERVMP